MLKDLHIISPPPSGDSDHSTEKKNAISSDSIDKEISYLYDVKDVRDEVHLLRLVFESQAKVANEFSKIFWPEPIRQWSNADTMDLTPLSGQESHEIDNKVATQSGNGRGSTQDNPSNNVDSSKDELKWCRDAFARDCGLDGLIERTKAMDQDATRIKEGVSSLVKESETETQMH